MRWRLRRGMRPVGRRLRAITTSPVALAQACCGWRHRQQRQRPKMEAGNGGAVAGLQVRQLQRGLLLLLPLLRLLRLLP